ncbi:MAG TPA: HYR domain-containing protein, partial [Pyrinomonadaceae bacterium]|nr:HYR domain-containing protein [Pyrinomonadaceae bacterium]
TNGLNTVSARNVEGGRAAVVFKGNTFDTVAQTASSNTGVSNVSGDGTLASNLLSVAVEGNTLNNIGRAANTCGTGTANCIGPRGIQVFIDDHTKVSGNVVVDGNTLTNVRRDGVFLDFNNSATGSDVNARVTGNTIGTDAARVGQVGQSGLRIFRRCFNFSQCGRSANVLVENNTIRNGSGAVASATTGPGLYSSTEDNASLNLVVLNNNIETNSTGPAEERSETRFPVGAGSTMCLNMGGDGSAGQANTLASGAGAIFLNEAAGTTLNVEQASTAALASANGIPAGNVTLTGTPQFGVSCSAPPSAWFNSATPAGQFYAGDATKNAGQSASAARALGLLRNNRVALLLAANEAAMPAGGKLALGSAFGYAREAAPVRVGANDDVLKTTTAHARARSAAALAAAVAYSGTVSLDIGTLPATKSMTITFKVTVNNTLNAAEISNQGQVSGTNFPAVLTDDPDTAAPNDPTVTPAGSPAEITCPADITVNTDPNAFSASVSFSATATGSPNPTVECKVGATVINSPHTFPVGTTSVQCTATNGIGAADSCSFNVTVNDNQTPVINCPANIVTTTDANSCAANVSVGTPTATDNDPNLNVAGTRSDGQPLNAPYPKGTTTITWTATDTAGNSASCQQTVTVNDDDAPVVSCPANIVVTLPANSSTAPVTFAAPTATDNCHNSLPVTLSHASGSQFPVGTTTVTASATDAAGNTGSCSFTVTVVYNFTGFFAPVANLPTFNKANAGQAIPVKFSLGG